MDNPMDSNEVCVGFIRNDVSFGLKTLKEFAYTERAEIVIDCMQKLFESLSDLDFDTSDDNYNEGYCNDEDFSDGWRIYGFGE
jgi:hypothetical protein